MSDKTIYHIALTGSDTAVSNAVKAIKADEQVKNCAEITKRAEGQTHYFTLTMDPYMTPADAQAFIQMAKRVHVKDVEIYTADDALIVNAAGINEYIKNLGETRPVNQ